jgi:hypothetical protein
MEENMLSLEKDPCEGCLVQPICEKMCPEVIDFYTKRVRKRSKQEVEAATGWYWEDDYVDQNGMIHSGMATVPKSERIKKENTITPIKIKTGVIEKFMNFINKRIIKWLQKNKNTLRD